MVIGDGITRDLIIWEESYTSQIDPREEYLRSHERIVRTRYHISTIITTMRGERIELLLVNS